MDITTDMIKQLRQITGAGPLDCKKALQAHNGDFDQAASYLREKGLAKAAHKADRETKAGLIIVQSSGDVACAVQVECETDFVARTDEFKALAHRVADQALAAPRLTDPEHALSSEFIDTPGKTTAAVIQELVGKLGENILIRRVARYTLRRPGIVESYIHSGDIKGGYEPDEGRVGVLVELGVGDAAGQPALRELAHDLALHIVSACPRYLAPADIPEDVMRQERENLMEQMAGENKPEHIKAQIIAGRLEKFYLETCLLKQPYVKDDSLTVDELLQSKSRELGTPITVRRFERLKIQE